MSHTPGHEAGHLSPEVLAVVIIETKDPAVQMAGETLDGADVPIGPVKGLRDSGVT
jgi:hypothetical protein